MQTGFLKGRIVNHGIYLQFKPMKMKKYHSLVFAVILAVLLASCANHNVSRALIITGQGDYNWKASAPVLKQILDETGLFSAKIITTSPKGGDMSHFAPDFGKCQLVVIDYEGDKWPEETMQSFVKWVQDGGGVVVYRGSVNAFPDWKEYGEMTGLRSVNDQGPDKVPFVYYAGNEVVSDTSSAPGGPAGSVHEFEVRTRVTDHPVTNGLPVRWMHAGDELLQKLGGQMANSRILATANSDTAFAGTGRNEPVLIATDYGKGRVFTTLLGHADEANMQAMQCAGFIVTLQRGAEWAATGKVTQEIPFDFPNAAGVVTRSDYIPLTLDVAFENLANYDIPKSTKNLTFIQDRIRKAGGDRTILLDIEKRMTGFLNNGKASVEAKKLILRELSWMGSEACISSVRACASDPALKDDAEFALKRLESK
jgi:type 1 glutamine amidotransferase